MEVLVGILVVAAVVLLFASFVSLNIDEAFAYLLAVFAFIALSFGSILGVVTMDSNHKQEAIKAGMAQYTVNPLTGETNFTYNYEIQAEQREKAMRRDWDEFQQWKKDHPKHDERSDSRGQYEQRLHLRHHHPNFRGNFQVELKRTMFISINDAAEHLAEFMRLKYGIEVDQVDVVDDNDGYAMGYRVRAKPEVLEEKKKK